MQRQRGKGRAGTKENATTPRTHLPRLSDSSSSCNSAVVAATVSSDVAGTLPDCSPSIRLCTTRSSSSPRSVPPAASAVPGRSKSCCQTRSRRGSFCCGTLFDAESVNEALGFARWATAADQDRWQHQSSKAATAAAAAVGAGGRTAPSSGCEAMFLPVQRCYRHPPTRSAGVESAGIALPVLRGGLAEQAPCFCGLTRFVLSLYVKSIASSCPGRAVNDHRSRLRSKFALPLSVQHCGLCND